MRKAPFDLRQLKVSRLSTQLRLTDLLLGAFAVALLSLGLVWLQQRDPAVAVIPETLEERANLVPLRKIPINEFVSVGASSPYRWILGPGFSPPEPDGAWVRSAEAYLIFQPEVDTDEYLVELSLSPFLPNGTTTMKFQLVLGETEKTISLGAEGGRVSIPSAGQGEQVLEIRCPKLESPAASDSNQDLRKLCIKVFAVAIWGTAL